MYQVWFHNVQNIQHEVKLVEFEFCYYYDGSMAYSIHKTNLPCYKYALKEIVQRMILYKETNQEIKVNGWNTVDFLFGNEHGFAFIIRSYK